MENNWVPVGETTWIIAVVSFGLFSECSELFLLHITGQKLLLRTHKQLHKHSHVFPDCVTFLVSRKHPWCAPPQPEKTYLHKMCITYGWCIITNRSHNICIFATSWKNSQHRRDFINEAIPVAVVAVNTPFWEANWINTASQNTNTQRVFILFQITEHTHRAIEAADLYLANLHITIIIAEQVKEGRWCNSHIFR